MKKSNTKPATPTAAALPENATTKTAATVFPSIEEMATQQTKAKKASIVNVEAEGTIYIVTYSTGTIKRIPGDKLPKTVQAWLSEHPAAEPVQDPEPEPETIVGMDAEPIQPEPDPEPVKAYEVEIPTPSPTTPAGSWPTVKEMILITLIRAGQISLFTVWLLIQLITACIRFMESIPVRIERARAVGIRYAAGILRAYQTATEATGTAYRYTVEVLTDTGRGFYHMGQYIRDISITAAATLASIR